MGQAGEQTFESLLFSFNLQLLPTIEQHILDTNARKTTVLSSHRCLINTGVEKRTTFNYRLEL